MKGWTSLLIAIAWPSVFAAPAVPDCSNTYPQALVSSTVADPKYKDCPGALQGYSSYVGQQRDLLRKLRPAYERELVAKADKDEEQKAKKTTRLKLDAFDQALDRVAAAASALPKVDFAASSPAAAASKAAAQKWLQGTRAESQRLNDRINDVASTLKGAELATYCQRDYFSRISTELEKKFAMCLKD